MKIDILLVLFDDRDNEYNVMEKTVPGFLQHDHYL